MNSKKTSQLPALSIESLIHTVRGERVIIDTDLAKVYGIPTFRLNEAVKRNSDRFPEDFLFRLTNDEYARLTSQIAISNKGRGGRRTLPYAFTEHGAIMAANVLNSKRAVQMSVFVVRAFITMRKTLSTSKELLETLRLLEKKLTKRLDVHESAIVGVLQRVMDIIDPPPEPEPKRRPIGFGRGET
jgi:hypothetical protein